MRDKSARARAPHTNILRDGETTKINSAFSRGGIGGRKEDRPTMMFFFSNRCVTPCAAKPVLCVPFWTGGREAGGSRSKNLPKAHESKMLGQGHSLRLLDEVREVGRHRHPGPEKPGQSAHD